MKKKILSFLSLTFWLIFFVAIDQSLHSSHFRVQHIQFHHSIDPLPIEETALTELSQIVLKKTSFFELDFEHIRNRLESHEWVHHVRLRRDFTGELHVYIDYRIPQAIFQKTPRTFVYLSPDAQLFGRVQKEHFSSLLPLVTGLKETDEVQIQEALHILSSWRQFPLRKKVTLAELNWSTTKGYRVLILHPLTISPEKEIFPTPPVRTMVNLGNHEHLEEKLTKLSLVLGYLQQRSIPIRQIGLELPKKVVVKLSRPA